MEEYYKQQRKIAEDEERAYETDKIVDYSRNFIAEKKLTSAKKENADYDIVTDQLEFDDEKQTEDRKVVAAAKPAESSSKPK